MPTFSAASKVRLASCHPDLQRIAQEVIKFFDFTVLVGHRGEEDQNKAVAEGKSEKPWPEGNHNKLPSTAYDIIPVVPLGLDVWDINDARVRCKWFELQYAVMRVASNLGIKVRWGMDWNGDGNIADTKLKDWPHWELIA